jgi:hypothetical protein
MLAPLIPSAVLLLVVAAHSSNHVSVKTAKGKVPLVPCGSSTIQSASTRSRGVPLFSVRVVS